MSNYTRVISEMKIRKNCNAWLALAFITVATNASADLYFNQALSRDWSLLDNWADTTAWTPATALPTLSDNIPLEHEPIISTGTVAEANSVWIGPWENNGVAGDLTVEGSLHTAGYLWVGSQNTVAGTDGTLTVNGGQIDVDDHLIIGVHAGAEGLMTINSGIVNTLVGGFFIGGNGTGHLEVAGGTINTSYLGFNAWGSGGGTINFSGDGQIITKGFDQSAEIQGWIDAGWIINAKVSYDGTDTITEMISVFVDVDMDGMSDPWEQQIIDADPDDDIVDIYDVLPGDDFDLDGMVNLDEYLADTEPVNALSLLRVDLFSVSNDTVTISYEHGGIYADVIVEYTANLAIGTWNPAVTNAAPTSTPSTNVLNNAATVGMYRVRAARND